MTYTKSKTFSQQWRWVTTQPGQAPFGWVQTFDNLGRTLTGEFNPKYKHFIRLGLSASTPLTASEKGQVCTPGWWIHKTSAGEWAVKGCFAYPPQPSLDLSLQQGAQNIALVRFYQDIRAQRNAFQGMTFLGELREAIGMVKHRFRKSVTLLEGYAAGVFAASIKHDLRKGNRAKAFRGLMRDIGNLYLEFTYGWKPTVMDIKNASEAILRLTGGNISRKTVRGFGKNQTFADTTTPSIYNNVRFNNHTQTVRSCIVVYKGGLALNLYGQGLQASARGVMDTLGFSLEEFVPTVWELIPYSFLADYFTNIGGILTAATTSTIDVTWVQKTMVDYATSVFVPRGDIDLMRGLDGSSFVSYTESPGAGFGWQKSVSRTPLTSVQLGLPSFELRLPAADSLQWLNTAVLGLQKVLGDASHQIHIRR